MFKSKKFSAFGLILSDILANGVIVILILMMVTIVIENETEKQKIEQAKDVTVILGREIMTSLVMNSLKSGPPSVLHDYKNSLIDKRIIQQKIPVFQLINDGLYELHSKTFWDKNTLLTNDSSLDNFLSKLSKSHKKLFRVDIFSIKHFHVFMSILRSHKMVPRHWHFMGENLPGNFTNLAMSEQAVDINIANGSKNIQNAKTSNMNGNDHDHDSEKKQSDEIDSDYFDDFKIVQGILDVSEELEWLDGDTQIGNKVYSDDSYQAIKSDNTNQISVSIAGMSLPSMNIKSDINQILATVYVIMQFSNKMIKDGTFTSLEKIDPLVIKSLSESVTKSELFRLWASEVLFLSDQPRKDKFFINKLENDNYYSSIGFYANNLQDSIQVYNHDLPISSVDKEHLLSFNLNTYPLLHKGNRIFVTPNTIISYVDDDPTSNYQWRTISLFDLDKGQIIIGLVYAAYNIDNEVMFIKAEENKPNLLGKNIVTKHKPITNKIEKLSVFFMVLIAAILYLYLIKMRKENEK